jgi:hypothetical protein
LIVLLGLKRKTDSLIKMNYDRRQSGTRARLVGPTC